MRAARAGGLTIAAAAVSTVVPAVSAGTGSAKGMPSTTYLDRAGGYSITIPKTWQPGTGFELHLVVQPKTHVLYELSFRIDAAVLNQAAVFTSIADNFRVV